MLQKIPATPQILRAQLRSLPSNGHTTYIPQIRKLVFEFCEVWPTSAPLRSVLSRKAVQIAQENPHVEIVLKKRQHKEPIIRGLYMNGRQKVIGLKGFEPTQVEQKIQLLLDASGAKIKSLKGRPVQSTTPSARGVWSGFHVEEQFKI